MTPHLSTPLASPPLPWPPGGALPLTHWGVIRATGPDAKTFLHAQLTQDIAHLTPHKHVLAGYCSPKGRLLGTFLVWQAGDDDLRLACSSDILPALLKRLQMFVMRAKCKLSDARLSDARFSDASLTNASLTNATASTALWGLVGEEAGAWLGARAAAAPATVWGGDNEAAAAQSVRLGDAEGQPRWLWAVDVTAPLTAPAANMTPDLPALSAADWDWLEVASGVPRIVAATADQFVPQMVNLELVDGVNFQKGCYPGQEVVARSQYRGTLKRRLFRVGAPVALQPGAEVFHADDPDQPAGMVANAASRSLPDGQLQHSALVVLKVSAVDAQPAHPAASRLHGLSAQGPALQLETLPYAVPMEPASGGA